MNSQEAADAAFISNADRIWGDVYNERLAQNKRWLLQRHPTLDKVLIETERDQYRHAEEFEIPNAIRAKFMCDVADRLGKLTWTHIAVEELAEAVEAAVIHGEHSTELREELVQLAAVVFAWIESVDSLVDATAAGVE